LFVGGAVGKFLCGLLAERLGVITTVFITEIATAVGILMVVWLPLNATFVILPVLGAALNGTSSVLYGSVADFVDSARRARAFGVFYTLGVGAGAMAPTLVGIMSDISGLGLTIGIIGCAAFSTLPLALVLRGSLGRATLMAK
jgi:MFS family permease